MRRMNLAENPANPTPRPGGRDTLVAVFVYNEGLRVETVLNKLRHVPACCDVLVVDDGSNDESVGVIARFDYPVIRHAQNLGVGISVREAIQYAICHSYSYFALIAGNGKMDPARIPLLLDPLRSGACDYVQGSRYLEGGRHENLPLFRHLMIKAFTLVAWGLTGFRGTDVTCGFRAYTLALFRHRDIDIGQSWLDGYEMEYYIHYKAIKLGYRLREVPVSMTYPTDGRPYSKIRPFVGWWSMVRPWVLLSLNLRH